MHKATIYNNTGTRRFTITVDEQEDKTMIWLEGTQPIERWYCTVKDPSGFLVSGSDSLDLLSFLNILREYLFNEHGGGSVSACSAVVYVKSATYIKLNLSCRIDTRQLLYSFPFVPSKTP